VSFEEEDESPSVGMLKIKPAGWADGSCLRWPNLAAARSSPSSHTNNASYSSVTGRAR
jgi:hypothetical protein